MWTVRFMGLSENKAEQEKDMKELSARAAAGKPLYGESDLDDYLQGVAMRNSLWSQLKLSAMPWWVSSASVVERQTEGDIAGSTSSTTNTTAWTRPSTAGSRRSNGPHERIVQPSGYDMGHLKHFRQPSSRVRHEGLAAGAHGRCCYSLQQDYMIQ